MTINSTPIDTYFLLAPDWGQTVQMGRSWKTTITTTKKGEEQRAAVRTIPKRTMKYVCVALQASLTNYGHRKLYNYMHRVFGIPIWVDGTELSSMASVAAQTLYVDEHDYREFEEGGKAVLLNINDPTTFEVVTIDQLLDSPARITLSTGLVSEWAEGTEIFPLLTCRLSSAIDISMITDRYNQFEIMAEETRNEVHATMTTTTTSSTTTTTTTTSSTTTTTTTTSSSTATTTTTAPLAWLSDWAYRVEITVDNTNIDSNLSHFPVPLILGTAVGQNNDDISFIFDEIGANSKKIAITKSDMVTQIYGEIEHWDSGSEKAVVWVSKSDLILSSSGVTKLYLYYDSTKSDNTTYIGDVTDTPAQNVWDSNFVGVWHMAQDPSGGAGAIKDSTSYGHHGSSVGSMTSGDLIDGLIGNALDFDGGDDGIIISDTADLSPGTGTWTIESLFKTSKDYTADENGFLIGNYGNPTANLYTILIYSVDNKPHGNIRDGSSNSLTVTSIGNVVNDNVWHHLSYIRETQTTSRLMLDGSSLGTNSNGSIGNVNTNDGTQYLTLGCYFVSPTYRFFFEGPIGETRISKTNRSQAWEKATKYSLFDDLISWGSEVAYA